jgi:hypothetical protein
MEDGAGKNPRERAVRQASRKSPWRCVGAPLRTLRGDKEAGCRVGSLLVGWAQETVKFIFYNEIAFATAPFETFAVADVDDAARVAY